MSNPLTGDFDLVAQFSIPTVNRILGSIHQKGDALNDGVTFLHSFRARIPQKQAAANSGKPVANNPAAGGGLTVAKNPGPGDGIIAATNPGAGGGILNIPGQEHVEGIIEVQVSTPSVNLVAGSSTRVTVSYQIMAHYIADDPSSTVPEFIHGELQVTCSIIQEAMGNQNSLLSVQIDAKDLEVNFIPAAGAPLSAQDVTLIIGELKTFLKTQFEPVNASLPKGVDFLRFKAMPGGTPAAALLISLTKAVLNQNAADGVTKTLITGSDDFAIAISSEFVLGLLDSMKQQIEQSVKPMNEVINLNTIFGSIWLATITTGSPSFQAQLANTGMIVISIKVKGHLKTSGWLFWLNRDYDWNLNIEQNLILSLTGPQPTFMLIADGMPNVTVTGLPMYQDTVKNYVQNVFWIDEIGALIQAQNVINAKIQGSLNLDSILKSALEISSTAKYKSLQVSADGLTLHGELDMAARPDVAIDFGLTADNQSYTALKTWIPAGTIQEYLWKWSVSTKTYPFNITKSLTEDHKFMIAIPADMSHEPSLVCLDVSGSQVPSEGTSADQVYAESACTLGSNGPSIPILTPLWWDKLAVGVLGLPEAGGVDQQSAVSLIAHIDARATGPAQANADVPTLVHFADARAAESMGALAAVLNAGSASESALSLVIILPGGMLERMQYKELAELRAAAASQRVALAFSEDYEGTWAKSLAVRETPSTHLLDGNGSQVWQHAGGLDEATLRTALDKHSLRGSRLRWRPLEHAGLVGKAAPDFVFDLEPDQKMALRRLQGRKILLNFWASWSSPCLEQLRYLESLQAESAENGTIILAVNDGEDPEKAAEFLRKNGLTLRMVPDEQRTIALAYGIRCWPTTVAIDEYGNISGVQLGVK